MKPKEHLIMQQRPSSHELPLGSPSPSTSSLSIADTSQETITSSPHRPKKSNHTRAQDTFIARLFAHPSVWNITRRPMMGVRTFAPKSRVLNACNNRYCQVFPTSVLAAKPSRRVPQYWQKKAQRMYSFWETAAAVPTDFKSKQQPQDTIRSNVETLCHYYYVVEETWSKEIDITEPTKEDTQAWIEGSLRAIALTEHNEDSAHGEGSDHSKDNENSDDNEEIDDYEPGDHNKEDGPVDHSQDRAQLSEKDPDEKADTEPGGTGQKEEENVGRVQGRADRLQDHQIESPQNEIGPIQT
ncbi:hypothetical protein BG000_003880 [Podila horticola]|nr:hypothetical protein BG000_003880 [Podila horticola]